MACLRIGILASHNGTTLQSVIDASESARLALDVAVVISNNSHSGAAARANRHGIAFTHLSTRTHSDPSALDQAILDSLTAQRAGLVLLAGYMRKLGPKTLRHYHGRIINTHPAMLPEFGGAGMYGRNVHEAVLAAGVSTTGVTIHLVESDYDTGPSVAQREVAVRSDDDVESLSSRVQTIEKALLIEVLGDIAEGRLELPGMKPHAKP